MISVEDDKIGQLKVVLDKKMQNADSITIVPHKRADFDAIGSAIALYLMALKHQKNTTILIDDPIYTLDSGVQTIIKEIESQGIDIIDYKEYKKIADSKNLLILIDTSSETVLKFIKIVLANVDKIIFLVEPNLLEIKKAENLLEIYIEDWEVYPNKIEILFNKVNNNSIDEEILKEIFGKFKIIGKIGASNKFTNIANNIKEENLLLNKYMKILTKLEWRR